MSGHVSGAKSSGPDVNVRKVQDMIKGANKFGFDVMRLRKTNESFIFSPVSAYVVLAMCPSLFEQDARAELLRGLSLSDKESDSSFGRRLALFLKCEESRYVSLYARVVVNPDEYV